MAEAFIASVPPAVRGVAQLVREVADAVNARFAACTVRGELSGITRAASGHLYFNLKDADGESALIRCAMFRRSAGLLDFLPSEGQLVELRGRVAVYEQRGELQFVAEAMRRAGEGALFEQFLRIKARLEAEGLFDASTRRSLPAFPVALGIVTSLGGAALHDVLSVVARRGPHLRLVVYPSLVQGAEAPAALAAAISAASTRAEVDVLLVCRGGGSLEDLWAFNDERVVRAIRGAAMPVITGVGHETDVTLADFAADLRAPTPTAAAELAAPSREASLAALDQFARTLRRRVRDQLDTAAQRLDHSALRIARPTQGLHRHAERLALLAHRLATHWPQAAQSQRAGLMQLRGEFRFRAHARIASDRQRMSALEARLKALDPSRVLARGYAWLTDRDGVAVTSLTGIDVGAELRAVLRDGAVDVQVTGVTPSIPE